MRLEEMKKSDFGTIVILIWWGLMIIAYGYIEYGLFTNPENNFWGTVFISLPIGVMFVGLPLVVLFRDDEDLAMGIVVIGALIFLIGLAISSTIPPPNNP